MIETKGEGNMAKKKLIAMALCVAMSTSICVPVSATELPGTTEISVEDSTELATTESQVAEDAEELEKDSEAKDSLETEENPTTVVETVTEATTTESAMEATTVEQVEEGTLEEDSEEVAETSASDFKWDGTMITEYTGTAAEVTIPEKCTAIGKDAFLENDNIITVNIGSNVKSIGDNCFENCKQLEIVNIPESVTYIGNYAFYKCKSLKNITIPKNIATLGICVFYGCASLVDITIPESVTKIGISAFYGCTSLKNITILGKVTEIERYAFYNCVSLTKIEIPENVEVINEHTFHGCTKLKEVKLPKNLNEIGPSAFYGCKLLENVIIPQGVTKIGEFAFDMCEALKNITIPDGVTEIEKSVFGACTSLTTIIIPEGVTKIGNGAFSSCNSLQNIVIPNTVTEIGDDAFIYCKSLTDVVIPDSVTRLGDSDSGASDGGWIFSYCTSLKQVTLGKGIKEIVPRMFSGCVSLTSIVIPQGVTKIGKFAFDDCKSLISIKIPESVTMMDDRLWSTISDLPIIICVYKDSFAYKWAKLQEGIRYMVIDMKLSPVQNLKAEPYGIGHVNVTWSKLSGADGYLVYTKKNGKSKYCGDTSNVFYEDWNALTTANNYYWVYPYKNDGNAKNIIGECPNPVYAKGVFPPVSNLKAVSAGKNKVKLTWNKPKTESYPEGYIIYAKRNTGKAAYIGMTSNTSYTDTKALDNAYNYYFVYPYTMDANGKRVIGKCPKYVYAKGVCLAVTNLKATSVKGGVKVTWTKSAGADGYLIYGKRGKDGKYGYIGVKTSNGATTFTDTKAKKDIYSFYWVFPYHYDANGKRVVGTICGYVYGKAK